MDKNMEKQTVINVRLTKAQAQILHIMAQREGISNADMHRLLIHEGAEKRGLNPIGLFISRLEKDGK